MSLQRAALRQMVWPTVFLACAGYLAWYAPKFILFFGWADDNITAENAPAGAGDFVVLAVFLIALVLGARGADATPGEHRAETPVDRLSLFLARVTMLLVVVMVSVMIYEVVLRYVFVSPTLWANELTLWSAGFVFLLAGLYAMQQRSHIRIFLLYDVLPRNVQRAFDTVSTVLIVIFAGALVYGGFGEAFDKLLRWETFGTAFDPPIPATIKPMILLVLVLVAAQAVANLIADWSKGPEHHSIVDEAEIEDIVTQARGHL